MAVISRPGKEGNATTYQGKVAAGYTNILAQEVDADIDAIYSAWNAGVDTVNIKPGAVGPAQLAGGSVTPNAIAPSAVQTAALADLAVTTPKLAVGSVTTTQILDGTIGVGDLAQALQGPATGNFAGTITFNPRGAIVPNTTYLDYRANDPIDPAYNSTKPSYLVRLDYTGDNYEIWRAPPPGTTFVRIFQLYGVDGKVYCMLADGSVNRTQLAVNAIQGNAAGVGNTPGFNLTTPNQWTNYAVCPPLTTRGGTVHLYAAPALSATVGGGGGNVSARWIRDGVAVIGNAWLIGPATTYAPLPGIQWIDQNAAAGTHNYAYQVMVPTGGAILSSGTTDGGFVAYEIG